MSGQSVVVVVTRHPDYSDEINVYGAEAKVVYLDLGADFNGEPGDAEQAREWAQGAWAEVKDLPEGHPARDEVLEVISYTTDGFFNADELEAVLKEELA